MADKENKKKSLPIIIAIISISIAVGLIGFYYITNQEKFDEDKKTAEVTTQKKIDEMGKIENKIVQKFTQAEQAFIKMLPADYDKNKAKKKFEELKEAAKNQKLDINELKEFQIEFSNTFKDKKLTTEEADKLLDMIDRVIIK